MQLGIFGVGRSGTTALYAGVQHLIGSTPLPCRFLYEPYLWSHDVFDAPFNAIKTRFQSTSSLSPVGIHAHCATPLFTERANPIHDQFISTITQGSRHFLLKAIRANGRLKLFLDAFPELRIVLVIRNPLDVVNSVIDRFSFFGDEFHPSDKPRFLEAISHEALSFSESDMVAERSEVEWSLLWWQYMNRAALQTASQYRDRVLIVAYEAFNVNPIYVFQKIGHFLELDISTLGLYDVKRSVGEVSKQVWLSPDQVDLIEAHNTEYWNELIHYSSVLVDSSELDIIKNILYSKYRNNASVTVKPQSLTLPTDWTTLMLRRQLLQLRLENQELQISQNRSEIPRALNLHHRSVEPDWAHMRFETFKQKL